MRRPFLLSPAGKDNLWGGEKLKTEYHKTLPLSPLAETWECSTHPDGECVVSSGPHTGQTLTRVLKEHPDYLGSHPSESVFPILIKFIDAANDLSVQVHPDDEYARAREGGQLGKTEFWYVLSTPPDGGEIVYGFREEVTIDELRESLRDGSVRNYLQRVKVKPGDVFFVRAGTVHAICGGVVVAEIQENSNLTYRLYDYDRVGADGKKRELHIDKALDVLDMTVMPAPRQPMRVLKYKKGYASEFLARCRYFEVDRLLIAAASREEAVRMASSLLSFEVLLCTEGEGSFFFEDETSLSFRKGDCFFVPASSTSFLMQGKAEFLKVRC